MKYSNVGNQRKCNFNKYEASSVPWAQHPHQQPAVSQYFKSKKWCELLNQGFCPTAKRENQFDIEK